MHEAIGRSCAKYTVASWTAVDAINDGDHVDPDGWDTTMKMGEARKASIVRNNGNSDSGET